MPKSIERRELDRDRRLAERKKGKTRRQELQFMIDLESGRLSERDDNWISIGYTGKKRR